MINMWPHVKMQLGKLAGASSAKMGDILILTSVATWLASSAAQIIGIAINKEYTTAQKKFMITQEAADALTNIGLYFAVTKSLTALTSHMVKTGKLAPQSIANFMNNNNLSRLRGSFGFDITQAPGFESAGLRSAYNGFKCFAEAAAATIGGVISSNILTPILRNKVASHRQNKYKAKLEMNTITTPVVNPTYQPATTPRHTFNDYRNRVLSI